jgi:hypothetical protein
METNAMTTTEATPQQVFEQVARTLCPGEAWVAALADLMGVRPDSVRQMRSGRLHLRRDHFETLLRILAERQTAMAVAEAQLRQWLAAQPKDPPG